MNHWTMRPALLAQVGPRDHEATRPGTPTLLGAGAGWEHPLPAAASFICFCRKHADGGRALSGESADLSISASQPQPREGSEEGVWERAPRGPVHSCTDSLLAAPSTTHAGGQLASVSPFISHMASEKDEGS